MVYYGFPQIGNSPQLRQRQWDNADDKERKDYIKAMVKWEHDFPGSVDKLECAIVPVAFKFIKEALKGGVK